MLLSVYVGLGNDTTETLVTLMVSIRWTRQFYSCISTGLMGVSLVVPSSIAGRMETECILCIMSFTNLPLCTKIVIYIFTLRSVIKQ